MAEHEAFYTPEHIDEQVDALLQGVSIPDEDLRLVQDLRIALTNADAQKDMHSLQNVLHRLLEENHSTLRWNDELNPSLEQMRQQKHGRIIHMRTTQAPVQKTRPMTRVFATLAAVLVVAALVGSMFALSHMARSGRSTATGSVNTTTRAASLPQGIYTSSSTTVFRLNGQKQPQVIWQQALPGATKIISAGDVVYVLQGGVQNTKYAVVELNASTGKVLWTHAFAAQQQGSSEDEPTDMVLTQNHLYVGWTALDPAQQTHGKIYVLNAVNGMQLSVYTNISLQAIGASDGIQTIDANDSVLAVGDRGLQVYNATTGKPLWHASMPNGGVNATVNRLQIVNHLVYVIFSNGDEQGGGRSYIAAYQATTGQQVWQSPSFPAVALYHFTVDQNTVYFGTLNINGPNKPFTGNVYAYDIQSNKQLWNTPVDGGAQEAFVVSNGTVYTTVDPSAPTHSHLIALNAATGAIKWHQTLDTVVLSSFCISNGILYMSDHSIRLDTGKPFGNASVQAFSADDGQKVWENARYGDINIVPTN